MIGLKANGKKNLISMVRKLNTRDKPEELNSGQNDTNVERIDLLKLGIVEHEEFKDEDKFSIERKGESNRLSNT